MHSRRFGLALFLLVAFLPLFPSETRALSILSGSSWLATATAPGGSDWTLPGFDDGGWIPAYSPYPPGRDDEGNFIPGTSARWMWYWNEPTPPTGDAGPLEAWFRYEFTLAAGDVPAQGHGLIVADDYFALYMNGHFVGEGHLDTRFGAFSVNFGQWLVPGDNVLAIYAFDGFHTGPADRGGELVLFDGTIAPVPEPATLALVGAGVVALASLRRRAVVTARSPRPRS